MFLKNKIKKIINFIILFILSIFLLFIVYIGFSYLMIKTDEQFSYAFCISEWKFVDNKDMQIKMNALNYYNKKYPSKSPLTLENTSIYIKKVGGFLPLIASKWDIQGFEKDKVYNNRSFIGWAYTCGEIYTINGV